MSQEGVESFLGRVITDKSFRERAIDSLEEACRSRGFSVSMKEIQYLKALDLSLFSEIAEAINGAIRRN